MAGVVDGLRKQWKMRSLSPVARAVTNDRLTYLSPEKLARIDLAQARTRNLAGDIAEFGVALGGSSIILAYNLAPGQRFAGFDVFGMIPPPQSAKDDAKSRERYEKIKSGQSIGIGGDTYYGYRSNLYDDVVAAFARHGVPVDGKRIRLHAGLFEETWPHAGVELLALAHIDCDWYDPVRYCLAACADILKPGGILVIDDYNDYGGCRTAVDEFLATRLDFTFEAGANPFLLKRT